MDEEERIPVSALQHISYCPRQYALIHIEQVFDENIYTIQGQYVHRNVDKEDWRVEAGVQVLTALPIWSDMYGLTGKCDLVEIREGIPYPVEYKHGRKKSQVHDEIQLCAQAICLEEMFSVPVLKGAVYQHSSRKRREINFTTELRNKVLGLAKEIREITRTGVLPPAPNDQRCTNCSLYEACMPWITNGKSTYQWNMKIEAGGEDE